MGVLVLLVFWLVEEPQWRVITKSIHGKPFDSKIATGGVQDWMNVKEQADTLIVSVGLNRNIYCIILFLKHRL